MLKKPQVTIHTHNLKSPPEGELLTKGLEEWGRGEPGHTFQVKTYSIPDLIQAHSKNKEWLHSKFTYPKKWLFLKEACRLESPAEVNFPL